MLRSKPEPSQKSRLGTIYQRNMDLDKWTAWREEVKKLGWVPNVALQNAMDEWLERNKKARRALAKRAAT